VRVTGCRYRISLLLLAVLLLSPTACSPAIRDFPAASDGLRDAAEALEAGRGDLILEGGGRAAEAATRGIVRRAGDASPLLCIVATANQGAGHPENRFLGFAGLPIRVLDVAAGEGDAPEVVAALQPCTGIYFDGGNPELLSKAFRPGGGTTEALTAIRERFERRGVTLSGTSAGAMIVGGITLCECGANSSIIALTRGELFQAPGFGLVENVLVDAHFLARGLLGRHAFALARNRLSVGIGIDEETAVVVPRDGGAWQVIGRRAVAILEAPPEVSTEKLTGFRLSLLLPGDAFDPASRKFRIAAGRRQVNIATGGTLGELADIFKPNAVRDAVTLLVRTGAPEIATLVPGTNLRVIFRPIAETQVWSDGRNVSVVRVAVDILRS
jgi:cyanophycinase